MSGYKPHFYFNFKETPVSKTALPNQAWKVILEENHYCYNLFILKYVD